jgi:hypothetical protein
MSEIGWKLSVFFIYLTHGSVCFGHFLSRIRPAVRKLLEQFQPLAPPKNTKKNRNRIKSSFDFHSSFVEASSRVKKVVFEVSQKMTMMQRIITFLLISSSSSFNLHLTRFNSRINVVKMGKELQLKSKGDNKEENKEEFDNYDIKNIMTKLDELQRTCNEMNKRINYLENENKKRVNTTVNIRDNTRTSISSSRSSTTTNTPAVTPSSFDQARRNLEDTWRIFQVMETDDEEGCDISNLEDLSEAAGCSNVKCEGVRSFRGRGGGEEGKGGAREIAHQLRPKKSQF